MTTLTLASHEQALEVGLRAMYHFYLSSHQVGMGFLDTTPTLTFEQFARRMTYSTRSGISSLYLDYFNGRMIKTGVEVKDNVLTFNIGLASPEYQSWAIRIDLQGIINKAMDEMTRP